MEDAGFIIGGYALTFVVVAFMSLRVLRQGRALGRQVPDEEKYWR